jgi:hypothetical protein
VAVALAAVVFGGGRSRFVDQALYLPREYIIVVDGVDFL